MSVTTTQPTTAEAILARLGSRRKAESGEIDAVQNRFLTLLTTQLKNQDPLNPMENAEITSQLAQLSTVQGIENLNKMFKEFTTTARFSELATLVGRGVLIPGDRLELTQAGAVGGVELENPAQSVKVRIIDANGIPVRTLDLGSRPAGAHNFVWDGKADNGEQAAVGVYRIEVEARNGSETVVARKLQLAQVTGVVRGQNGADLQVGEHGIFRLDEIRQVLM
ncbi:MAG: flagellar hook assembly protein FlgD [Hydrogenophilus sp.]|nr:flagellar hook assembly protein FlgD [Hydrogenophilus sp.]